MAAMAALADTMRASATTTRIMALSAAAKGRCRDPSFSLRGLSGITSSSSISSLSMCAKMSCSAKCPVFSNSYGKFSCKATIATPELKTEQEQESFMLTGVSLRNMEDANLVIHDFLATYMVFHNMDQHRLEDVFRHLALFYYIAAQIYKTDDLNEIVGRGAVNVDASEEAGSLLRDPFKVIKDVLRQKNLLTERVVHELDTTKHYWRLERSFCTALSEGKPVVLEDVMRTLPLRCLDYRLLFLILYDIRGAPVNSLHMEVLCTLEMIGEMVDDLEDYESDVRKNTFNAFRAFVNIYGPSQAPTELSKFLDELERKYESVLSQLEPEFASHFRRLGKYGTASSLGDTDNASVKWNIPPVIADEAAYRASMTAKMNGEMEDETERVKLVYI